MMSDENMAPEELESGLSANPEAEINEPAAPREVDPAQLAELERRLAAFKESTGQTASGSVAPTVDLSDFELDPEIAHLYRRGRVEDRETSEGPKPTWVSPEHQYLIVDGNYNGSHGMRRGKGQGQHLFIRLDDNITAIVNGPEGIMSVPEHGWRLSAILPNSGGMGVAVFERNVKRELPDPTPVQKTTTVADVKDEELMRMNEEAQQWAAGQDGQVAEPTS
jgi:hypothetical protein